MVLENLWVSQNFSQISQVSQSRFFSGYMCLAYEGVSESRFFCNAKDLEVPVGLFSFLNDVFSSLGGEFH